MKSLAKLFVVMAGLLLAGCASGPIVKSSHVEGELRGMVYDLDRQPLADSSVSVKSRGQSTTVTTDLHGRFGTGSVPFGLVTLSIRKPGYEPLEWNFNFSEGSQVLYLQLANTDQLFEKAALALEKKDWKTFQIYLDRGKALSAQSIQGYILEATAFEKRGDLKKAITILESYTSVTPILAIELYLGDLYSASGDNESAVRHWKKALELKEDAVVRAKVVSVAP